MSLNLEASARILLHIASHLLDLLHRLRLQRSLASLEEDIIGHELTSLCNGLLYGREIGGLTLIEISSTLGEHYISNASVGIFILNNEYETSRRCYIRQIDEAVSIDVEFEGSFVE